MEIDLGQTSAKNMLRKIEENHLRYQFHGQYIVWATQEFLFLKKEEDQLVWLLTTQLILNAN